MPKRGTADTIEPVRIATVLQTAVAVSIGVNAAA